MSTTRVREVCCLSLFIFSSLLGTVSGQNGCGDCYRIGTGVIVGIVVGDVVITVLIAMATYYLTKRGQRKTEPLPMKESSKGEVVQTESPYEELRAADQGLYSELKPRYK